MIPPDDHVAILALYAEYNRAIDAGDSDSWAATFVDDGVFHHPSRDWCGADERRQFVTERTAKIAAGPIGEQLHWNGPVTIDGTGASATGGCALLVSGVARDGGRAVVIARGCYADRLARTAEGWRFTERALTIV